MELFITVQNKVTSLSIATLLATLLFTAALVSSATFAAGTTGGNQNDGAAGGQTTNNNQNDASQNHGNKGKVDVIWYGTTIQGDISPQFDAVVHLKGLGVTVDVRSRPLSHLNEGKVVVINNQGTNVFSKDEIKLMKNYVKHGGKLILAADTDYFHCSPSSTCAMEVSRNFGFGFNNDIQTGTLIPAPGQSGHPIWNSPNILSSFTNWCCDAYIPYVIDSANVTVLSILAGDGTATIVLNENPTYKGGKVMGLGYNMLVGLYGDFTLFENIMSFMLGRTLGP